MNVLADDDDDELCTPCDDERPPTSYLTQKQLQAMSKEARTLLVGGRVWACCGNCTLDWRLIEESFMPDTNSSKSARRASELKEALSKIKETTDRTRQDELMTTIIKKRTSECKECMSRKKLSPAELACKQFWEQLKYKACRDQGGCPTPGCAEKGMASWIVLQADHVGSKVHMLSDYCWWSCHGGVEAMTAEAKNVQFICGCCHRLRPTSNTGKQREQTTVQWKINMNLRRKEKEDHVNDRKLAIGKCQYPDCPRVVTRETVRCFDFDHRDERTKATHETMPTYLHKNHSGVAGLVHNCAKHASLKFTQSTLDAEMDKCDVLCHNCHVSRKMRKRKRWDDSPPESS